MDGVVYVLQLFPEQTPGVVKVGWSRQLEKRIASHRCVAPAAVVLFTYPCSQSLESIIHQALAGRALKRIGREVFEFEDSSVVPTIILEVAERKTNPVQPTGPPVYSTREVTVTRRIHMDEKRCRQCTKLAEMYTHQIYCSNVCAQAAAYHRHAEQRRAERRERYRRQRADPTPDLYREPAR